MLTSLLILAVLFILVAIAGCFDSFKFSNDTLEFTGDKLQHAIGSIALFVLLVSIMHIGTLIAYQLVFILGTLWEIKDGFMDYKKYGWIGGDGFSYNDIAYDMLGVSLVILISYIMH